MTTIVYFVDIDDKLWIILGNSTGYSILTSLIYVGFFCFNDKYCHFTKISSLALLLISVFNTISYLVVADLNDYLLYESLFSKLIIIITFILTLSLSLIKCKHYYLYQKQS